VHNFRAAGKPQPFGEQLATIMKFEKVAETDFENSMLLPDLRKWRKPILKIPCCLLPAEPITLAVKQLWYSDTAFCRSQRPNIPKTTTLTAASRFFLRFLEVSRQ
jgi:hypothetical protein